eukprot:1146543-Pelagomonas_calceolata.AAC.3
MLISKSSCIHKGTCSRLTLELHSTFARLVLAIGCHHYTRDSLPNCTLIDLQQPKWGEVQVMKVANERQGPKVSVPA